MLLKTFLNDIPEQKQLLKGIKLPCFLFFLCFFFLPVTTMMMAYREKIKIKKGYRMSKKKTEGGGLF